MVPVLVQAVDEGTYVAGCLACGLAGPEREDGWDAKLAFDEAFQGTGERRPRHNQGSKQEVPGPGDPDGR
jgi:hypothetical protein